MIGYTKQYYLQRAAAKHRNIDWQFTYDTWIEWWGEDIINRGRSKGKLCMARHNDIGPYHPDNVRKASINENCSEANKGKKRPRTEEHQAKLTASRKGYAATEETRQKVKEAITKWWANKKATEA